MATVDGKKTGGRVAGVPNKKSLSALLKAQEMKVDPFEFLLNVIKGDWKALGYESGQIEITMNGIPIPVKVDRITLEMRISAAKEAVQYLMPKRKALEHSMKEIPDEELAVEVKERLEKRLNGLSNESV